jgi:hypothetical protein
VTGDTTDEEESPVGYGDDVALAEADEPEASRVPLVVDVTRVVAVGLSVPVTGSTVEEESTPVGVDETTETVAPSVPLELRTRVSVVAFALADVV